MRFLVRKFLTLMVDKFYKITSPKAVCILFQALNALIAIEFFPYKLV